MHYGLNIIIYLFMERNKKSYNFGRQVRVINQNISYEI